MKEFLIWFKDLIVLFTLMLPRAFCKWVDAKIDKLFDDVF